MKKVFFLSPLFIVCAGIITDNTIKLKINSSVNVIPVVKDDRMKI